MNVYWHPSVQLIYFFKALLSTLIVGPILSLEFSGSLLPEDKVDLSTLMIIDDINIY